MITYLNRLTAERDSLTEAATQLTETAAEEERDLTESERDSIAAWSQRCGEIDAQLTEYGSQAESQRAYARLRDQLQHHDDAPTSPSNGKAPIETRGWGDLWVESEEFQRYQGNGSSTRLTVPGIFEQRAAIKLGDFPAMENVYAYTPPARAQTTPLLDAIGRVTVGSNTVEWVEWVPPTPAAAPIVPEGELKPELALSAVPHTDSLDTYAHWKGITRQALEDVPQIRSIVENRLRGGLFVALEAAVQAALVAATLPGSSDPDLLTGIREGIAVVQGNGFTPNAALLNPMDLAAIDISVMGSTVSGPTRNMSAWGIQFIPVASVPAGTSWVGDLDAGVQLFDRGTANIFMTDSHADMFIRNIVLILAELRALVAVTEPVAIVEVTVVP